MGSRCPAPACRLELSGVRHAYAPGGWELAVDSLSLGGEGLCGVVGPNGSGKSTLLRVAAGLLAPREGAATIDGRSLVQFRRKALARELGYLPQECPSLFDYSVEQVAAMGRHAHGGLLDAAEPGDAAAVTRALEAVQLEPLRRRVLSQLSGGERRRAWLACAFAQEPRMLLLDEPTQALDLHQAAAVLAVLAQKAAEGLRVVAVLHDLNLAALFCERLVLLDDGKIVADGTPGDVLAEDRLRAVYGGNVELLRFPGRENPVILAKKR
jgi:ABC-type cobalamin/Fe3+-siderophores transport system ATPase subunit